MLGKILTRYIFKEITKTFLVTFCLLTLVTFFLFSIQIIHKLSKYLDLLDIITLAPYLIGMSAGFTIPLSMLAATTLLYGRMAYEKEILILRAGGIHFHQMFQPVFFISILLSGVCFYIKAEIVPVTLLKRDKLKYKALEKIISAKFSPKETTIYDIPNLYIYYRKLEGGKFHSLVILHTRNNQITERVLANTGTLVYEQDKKLLTFYLQDGSISHISHGTELREEKFFFHQLCFPVILEKRKGGLNDRRTKYKTTQKLSQGIEKYKQLALRLKKEIQKLQSTSNQDSQKLERLKREYQEAHEDYLSHCMEWHERIASSLVTLLVVLLGCPLGILVCHDNRLVAFGVSALPVLLIYYPLLVFSRTLEYKIPPYIAAWLPNFITASVGVLLLFWVYRK